MVLLSLPKAQRFGEVYTVSLILRAWIGLDTLKRMTFEDVVHGFIQDSSGLSEMNVGLLVAGLGKNNDFVVEWGLEFWGKNKYTQDEILASFPNPRLFSSTEAFLSAAAGRVKHLQVVVD